MPEMKVITGKKKKKNTKKNIHDKNNINLNLRFLIQLSIANCDHIIPVITKSAMFLCVCWMSKLGTICPPVHILTL